MSEWFPGYLSIFENWSNVDRCHNSTFKDIHENNNFNEFIEVFPWIVMCLYLLVFSSYRHLFNIGWHQYITDVDLRALVARQSACMIIGTIADWLEWYVIARVALLRNFMIKFYRVSMQTDKPCICGVHSYVRMDNIQGKSLWTGPGWPPAMINELMAPKVM